MLDAHKVRSQADATAKRLADRNAAAAEAFNRWLEADIAWRQSLTTVDSLKSERNKVSKEVGARKSKGENADELMARAKEIGAALARQEGQSVELEKNAQAASLLIPNVPHESVPAGADAEANPEMARWGEPRSFNHQVKNHIELGESLGILDFEGARKISGAGFIVFKGAGAKLERALIQFLLDHHTSNNGYVEVSTPFLVHRASMTGTGQLPKFEEDLYQTPDGSDALFLVPTAEVPVTNLHREEILTESQLPIQYAAYSPCFRKEAGSHGRDTRGLVRLHQFDKVELVKIVKPETSYDELEKLRRNAEGVLELLGLPYRTILLCTGDMGFGAAKCYDIEVWAPGEGRYLEVSSCSNFEDFQARRMNLRYKNAEGKNIPCHTLNGSGTALPRLVIALLETYQQADGSVKLPAILAPYMGGEAALHLRKA